MVQVADADSGYLSEPGDMSDDEDSDVEVGGVTQDYKCPLTLTPLQDPLTSCVPPSPSAALPISAVAKILGKYANTPSLVMQSANTSLVV